MRYYLISISIFLFTRNTRIVINTCHIIFELLDLKKLIEQFKFACIKYNEIYLTHYYKGVQC